MTEEQKFKEARKMLLQYLKRVAYEKKISPTEIAAKTGFTENNVIRMLAGRYSPTLENFIKLANSVGVYFFIIDKDEDSDLVTLMKNRWGEIFIQ